MNAPAMARSSRLFFSVLIAERLLHQGLPPGCPARIPRAATGGGGGAVKSASAAADGAHGKTPATPFGGSGADKRPSGARGRAGDGETAGATGHQEQSGAPGCLRRPAPGLTPSVERADAERRLFLRASSGRWSVSRDSKEPAARRPDEPYGPADQRGRDVRRGPGATAPRDVPSAAPATNRGPVEFADAASGRSTPSGVAACNERTFLWPHGTRVPVAPASGGSPRAGRGPQQNNR